MKKNSKTGVTCAYLPVASQSLKTSCGDTMVPSLNLSLSRTTGTAERQGSAVPLQFPSSQTSSRPRTIFGVAVAAPFFAYVKEKYWDKKVAWTSGAVLVKGVSSASSLEAAGFTAQPSSLCPFPINTAPCGFPIITLLIAERTMLAVCCLARCISFCRWVNNHSYL